MDKDTVKPLKELLDSIKDIDGFPIGKDEDILAISDPPFYTACPNPYISRFIDKYGKRIDLENDDYHCEPYIGDVSEGKNDPKYMAHSYHTKVPPKAIENYISHYTNPGDIVFDGFCGTGMTGVAAFELNRSFIILDISSIASFISSNYVLAINIDEFKKETMSILNDLKKDYGWMYQTIHNPIESNMQQERFQNVNSNSKGIINNTVWSDVLMCPYCQFEYEFFHMAVDMKLGVIHDQYKCPGCNAIISKKESQKVFTTYFDSALGKDITQLKQNPVLISYTYNKKRYEKIPDQEDLRIIEKINEIEIPYWHPTNEIPKGDKTGEPIKIGITHSHHFFTKRNLCIISSFWEKAVDNSLKFLITSSMMNLTKMYRYRTNRKGGINTGTLYIPSLFQENDVFLSIRRKINDCSFIRREGNGIISTQSNTDLSNIPGNSIDYIFTDPPFGNNLMYSELSFVWESWLKIITQNHDEAIINKTQNKTLPDYTNLMVKSFQEMFRILKPNRWITVEFHNSQASVWNGIQEAMNRAGFIIAQVAILNKKQGSYNQVRAAGAVKNDLVINAYKPKAEFSEQFLKNAGEGMEVDFVVQQLKHLPVMPNIERTEKMLYSKMLAHYVENGFKVKYNSTNFYKLLSDNFTELDGYWFLDSQVKKYNEWKSGLSLDELREKLSGQQVIVITDEKSALTWMYYFLVKPHTYSDIYTGYQQVATTTDDAIPELMDLLENNFILEDGTYRRPLSESEKADVEKNHEKERERAFNKLLKQAKEGKGKIKNVRREALVYGFTKCYQEGRYQDILTVANKLYASTLEASGEIMDFVDIARIKTAGEKEM